MHRLLQAGIAYQGNMQNDMPSLPQQDMQHCQFAGISVTLLATPVMPNCLGTAVSISLIAALWCSFMPSPLAPEILLTAMMIITLCAWFTPELVGKWMNQHTSCSSDTISSYMFHMHALNNTFHWVQFSLCASLNHDNVRKNPAQMMYGLQNQH